MSATQPLIIGFGSRARVGKDYATDVALLLCSKLGIKARRKAFADPVKEDLEGLVRSKFGIDIWTAQGNDKEIIRPTIVAHGMAMRARSATYWVDRLADDFESEEKDLTSYGQKPTEVVVISDVRFENEVRFVKSWGGIYVDIIPADITLRAKFRNIEEQLNSPRCGALADYVIENSFDHVFAQRIAGLVARHVYKHEITLGQRKPSAPTIERLVASGAISG